MQTRRKLSFPLLVTLGFMASLPVIAQDEGGEDAPQPPNPERPLPGGTARPPGVPGPPTPGGGPPPGPGAATDRSATVTGPGGVSDGAGNVPCLDPKAKVKLEFQDTPVEELVRYFARVSCKNFILGEELNGKVTMISHQEVSVWAAYEAFLSALEVAGYTTVEVGNATKVVPTSKAGQAPLKVYEGENIPYSDAYVTQIFELTNVSVTDISTIAKELAGPNAKIIAYAPTNTLIITDSAVNIRRMWKVVSQLDVAAPKAHLEIVTLSYATASEVKALIEEIYGTAATTSSAASAPAAGGTSSSGRRRRTAESAPAASEASSTNVGAEGRYIEKVVADERTNSLIILANDEAMAAVKELIAKLDSDVDPFNRQQIHVIYLEHAKAEDVAQVLSSLSQDSRSNSSNRNTQTNRPGTNSRQTGPGGRPDPNVPVQGNSNDSSGAAALLDGEVKVTADENTNSLVVVASPEAFVIIEQVVAQLDIRRKQVFVDVVIMELAAQDEFSYQAGVHAGKPNEAGGFSYGAIGLGASTLTGISADVISGAAVGVYGPPIEVSTSLGTVSVPAFGIALNALQANSTVNILSNPSVLTLDNEEAKIVVGRNIPFPVSTSRDQNNNPIVQYQREDVAITLKVTPQINESDFVTLEVYQEVTEIEEDSQGLDVSSAGFITSKRSAETTVLVKDNQTIVIGGLMGQTETSAETKIPVLGDLPLIGALFRGHTETSRKTNLLIFLTPHVIDEPADLEEVYRIKVAQREEFIRRFYGKTYEEQMRELDALLSYSMNLVDQEASVYRTRLPEEKTGETVPDSGEGQGGVGAEPAAKEEPAPEAAEPATTPDPATEGGQ